MNKSTLVLQRIHRGSELVKSETRDPGLKIQASETQFSKNLSCRALKIQA